MFNLYTYTHFPHYAYCILCIRLFVPKNGEHKTRCRMVLVGFFCDAVQKEIHSDKQREKHQSGATKTKQTTKHANIVHAYIHKLRTCIPTTKTCAPAVAVLVAEATGDIVCFGCLCVIMVMDSDHNTARVYAFNSVSYLWYANSNVTMNGTLHVGHFASADMESILNADRLYTALIKTRTNYNISIEYIVERYCGLNELDESAQKPPSHADPREWNREQERKREREQARARTQGPTKERRPPLCESMCTRDLTQHTHQGLERICSSTRLSELWRSSIMISV